MNAAAAAPAYLVSFYGDDFTGSTDVMEALTMSGVPTALFLEPPSPEELERFRLLRPMAGGTGRLAAFGVPGISRTMSPEEMRSALPATLRRIAAIPSRFFHYKICSTFDSSPTVGNIGVATDLALQAFPSDWVPLLVGAPSLGRYCVFAQLFARVGAETYRLDRHPTMARHPITPMEESDLRLHLRRQTPRPVAHVDLQALEEWPDDRLLPRDVAGAGRYVLFDTLNQRHLLQVGQILCRQPGTRLIVGSSGVEYAICGYLADRGELQPMGPPEPWPSRGQLIVMTGSAAPGTARQIDWALRQGFGDLRLDAAALIDPARREAETQRVVAAAVAHLQAGRSPLLYTARGPDDPALAAVRASAAAQGEPSPGTALAAAQGQVLRRLLETAGRHRVVVGGGDTSGFAARALGIHALEMRCPIAPGAPLCLAHSDLPAFHGLELSLKGGQNGNERYFEAVLQGRPLS
jgi:3-oxoisoapionate kinase